MDRLPTEIILAIIHEIPNTQDRLTLVQICRRWRASFLGIAFCSTHLEWPQVRCLVVAALANPVIRFSIRKISIENVAHRATPVPLGSPVQEIIDLISESPVEYDAWRKGLSENQSEVWIALLMAILPNLAAVSAQHSHPQGWITRIVSKAAWRQLPFEPNTLPALQRLEKLDLTWCGLSTVLSHREYLPFLHLPYLRSLRLGPAQELHSTHSPADHPAFLPVPARSPVEDLVLDFFCNGRHGMVDFITSCANLKRFVYQHTNYMVWVSRQDEEDCAGVDASFRPWCFHEALQTQKHSLEVLHLNDLGDASIPRRTHLYKGHVDPISHDRWFGSLADFRKLWDLHIRASNLLNLHPEETEEMILLGDILPKSLRVLHLADCNDEICAVLLTHLEDLLARREEQFPSLQSLLISPEREEPHGTRIRIKDSFRKQWTALQEMYDRVGVRLSLGAGGKMETNQKQKHWSPGRIVDEALLD
ncbi:hypothetical protein F9C07_11460 [Aspergillus flavus]|uniref:Leucine-rich repeat domain-containing protein n=1 Tax=Aspergillus flavus (strain ATCC 200026 / FGSC A1120 / IAM 13836 / NRRL 3357 / JCM 12722 / SRRC 167) TaxID=332952 RepID=A0A7G5KCE8_ASPFN|nr:uncharacterized protein G4B84_008965 [Aspergillus flavus NRRL3357]KAF7622609.1 hypothetical protein AFLA_009936 [Aspergillus flavus NRRL3357]QMW33499.1 hypothetical protein G4B84_008965 [Aspergillus flavus NRRL3357]QMW45540.1 hypothetical protein G4B11_008995 [Aspergillus flavus]QRD94834.1 hypothetical protein F9C07_11460 [Aspergillus flavus]